MSSSLATSLYERLLRSFPADRAYTQADWDKEAMPGPVRHFLIQLLRHHSKREARRLRRARTEWVDYDHPEMEEAVRTFFAAVQSHTKVPRDQWAETLQHATHRTTTHLVRPVDVLTDFVFGKQTDPLRIQRALWRMNFFGPYSYLRDAVKAFANQNDLDTFEPSSFERVLRRVDERITADFDADRWLQLLEPLFEVAHRATGQRQVSPSLLRTFFEEKNVSPIGQRLRAYEEQRQGAISPKALYGLIEEAQAPSSPPHAPSSPEHPDPAESSQWPFSSEPTSDVETEDSQDDIWGVAGSARPAGAEIESSSPAEDDRGTPLWKQFQQGRSGSNVKPESNGGNNGQPLWAQFQHHSSSASDPDVPVGASDSASSSSGIPTSSSRTSARTGAEGDLSTLEREVLGTSNPPHRSIYIRQLFNGDKAAYRRVLERLQSTESWNKASQVIASDIFRAHKVNIYSDAAVHFTNAVESRFRKRP